MSAVDSATVERLNQDLGDDPGVMRELIDTFLGEAPRLIETMREGLAKNNARELNRAAHSLKSTAATFGAMRLSQMCRDLEELGARAVPADSPARVGAIESEWAIVRMELEKLRP